MKLGPCIWKIFPAAILALVLVLVSSAGAQGQILLTVDITNPDAVVFTATGTAPSGTVTGYTFNDGIDLVNFFTGDVLLSDELFPSSNTLTTGDSSGGPLFNLGQSTFSPGTSDTVDLNLYNTSDSSPLTFTTGEAAFTGSLTLNLSVYPLPSLGTGHAVLAGFSDGGTPIGSYIVVEAPEPSTWTFIALGFIAVAWVRGRRARICKRES